MGRYYQNQFGEEGKFWFGVQPSDDPETIFGGMDVTSKSGNDGFDECYADYDIYDEEFVKKALDEQYDILEVPKAERKYYLPDAERTDYVWGTLFDYIFTYEKPENFNGIPYGSYTDGVEKTYYPKDERKTLAASRVALGLFILSTIERDGSCQLTADL